MIDNKLCKSISLPYTSSISIISVWFPEKQTLSQGFKHKQLFWNVILGKKVPEEWEARQEIEPIKSLL